MPLISHALVILATSLIASPDAAHSLPQQSGGTHTPTTPLTTPPSTLTTTSLPANTTKIHTTPLPERDVADPITDSPPASPEPSKVTTTPPQNTTDPPDTTLPTTLTPPTTTDTTTDTTTTTTTTPPTTTPTTTTTTTTPQLVNVTTASTLTPNTTTVITTTPQLENTTDTPIPSALITSTSIPNTTDSSPSSTDATAPPPAGHTGASVAISLFILVTVVLVIGASVWWVRRRWQLERLRHQLMPVYNFDPTDDVDDWENQLLEEERSLRPEADKVQLYSGNATFEASQKTPSSATQKE